MHKLTAGCGYDYYTQQVAVHDTLERGHNNLATYYTSSGETPGEWIGTGLAGLGGLSAGDEVTADQMRSLFGAGKHPLAEQRLAALVAAGITRTAEEMAAAELLGTPYRTGQHGHSDFQIEVAIRLDAINTAAGLPQGAPVSIEDRARVRTEVGVEFFTREFGRAPKNARELTSAIARWSRDGATAVAGLDVTFSPVKSVSALWAVAPPRIAAQIELAHRAAIADALRYLEGHALFSREGRNGVRQVEVKGLVATAFTHRDSRAGDPDLHTHVVIANKVQTLAGKWLSIDGRLLYKAMVSVSETYNSALERHLQEQVGLTFAERPNEDVRKQAIREVVGVEAVLNERWSQRGISIEARRRELSKQFQAEHHRAPTAVEAVKLAQQATLETRDAKKPARTLVEQRAAWMEQAVEVLGGRRQVDALLSRALRPRHDGTPIVVDEAWLDHQAASVIQAVEARRATWQVWHVRAEAHRQLRDTQLAADRLATAVEALTRRALQVESVPLSAALDRLPAEPAVLRRRDGSSQYSVAGSATFTSQRVLDAEARILGLAGRYDGRVAKERSVDIALLEATANGVTLNAGQAQLVKEMCLSGSRVQLAIAPAGSGKTTAMQALTRAWIEDGGAVLGLAPSAAAAVVLRDRTDTRCDTLAKLAYDIAEGHTGAWDARVGPDTLVIIDEAGMAGTVSLDAAIGYIVSRGGSVRLIGDDQQLAAIGAGGVLRDIRTTHGAVTLTELMRFDSAAEAAASLALRDGLPEAIGFYLDHDRVHVGDLAAITDQVFAAWNADHTAGKDVLMMAPTRELVAELNQRARTARLADTPVGATVRLGDGNDASAGDLIITRKNRRDLRISATDWVKNGDRWIIEHVAPNGALRVHHHDSGLRADLPADYVAEDVDLGYACTIHGAQGVSVDTTHGLLTGTESLQQLYTMLTRGATANHLYLQVVGDGDDHSMIRPETLNPPTAADLIADLLGRDTTPASATTNQRDNADPATRLTAAAAAYRDALLVAADTLTTPEQHAALDSGADQLLPGLTTAPAWATLRSQLLLQAAHGHNPLTVLNEAMASRELDTARDLAAVLDWRLDPTGRHSLPVGPLPWLHGIPTNIAQHDQWGAYLGARAALVSDLAQQVRDNATTDGAVLPSWVDTLTHTPSTALVSDVTVWRAATGVEPADRRPLGRTPDRAVEARQFDRLAARLRLDETHPTLDGWTDAFTAIDPHVPADTFAGTLAERLTAMTRAGIDAHALLGQAAGQGALPDEHAAAALWWRITQRLTPAVTAAPHRHLDRTTRRPHQS